jgi:hypothetical protein
VKIGAVGTCRVVANHSYPEESGERPTYNAECDLGVAHCRAALG